MNRTVPAALAACLLMGAQACPARATEDPYVLPLPARPVPTERIQRPAPTAPAPPTAQEIITVCGPSKGLSFYPGSGWTEDGVSKGATTFQHDGLGGYEIVIKDAVTTFSARKDGAQIVKVNGSDRGAFTLLAVFPLGTTEIYQLMLDQNGKGVLYFG